MTKQSMLTKQDLLNYMQNGFKAPKNYQIGIEFEVFLYNKNTFQALEYQVKNAPSILNILESYNTGFWTRIYDDNHLVGLNSKIGNISLEPAGQLEFSSIPFKNINEIAHANATFWQETLNIANNYNIGIYALGLNPKHSINQLPLMPKERYLFMNQYMDKVGTKGKNMMRQTCTIQTNIDYSNDIDLAKKFRISMALAPIVSAMYANSPLLYGKKNNYLSYRNYIWQHTDNTRTGFLAEAFQEFSLEKYLDYALNIPMYFLYRNEKYIKIPHITFKDYLLGKLTDYTPTIDDFITHLATLFPHVRLKTYLEIRYADCVDLPYLESLPALFVGLFYNSNSLENIYNLIKKWSFAEVSTLYDNSMKYGLNTTFKNQTIQEIATEVLNIAFRGLKARKLNEEMYLYSMQELVKSGKTLAEEKLDLLTSCNHDIDKFITAISLDTNL